MLNLLKKNSIILLCLLCALMLTNCDKDKPSLIGLDVVEFEAFNAQRTDTISMLAHSFVYDKVNSGNISDDNANMLGAVYDATFGKTTSSLAMGYYLSRTYNFENNPVADSVEISFAFNGSFGDKDFEHTIKVYELTERLYLDSSYQSNHRVSHSGAELASLTFVPSFDTVVQGNVKLSPSFKMKLDKSFGDKIFAHFKGDKSVTNAKMEEKFFGLYLATEAATDPSTGSFLRMALSNAETYIKIYYKNKNTDSIFELKFSASKATPRFMEYDHNNYLEASPDFRAQVIYKDTTLGNQLIYIQSLGGVAAKISMPHLSNFKSVENIAIANAVIKFHTNLDDTYIKLPPNYELVRMNDEGRMVAIADYVEGAAFYMGNLAADSTISFRVTRHLQNAIMGNYKDPNLYLHVRGSSFAPGRCVLFGPNSSDSTKNIKLEITYTSVK